MIPSIRPLSDGRLFVLDRAYSRLLLVDRDCRQRRTVLDSASPSGFPIGSLLVAAPADTTWLFDYSARGFRVLNDSGRTIRRQAIESPALLSVVSSPWTDLTLDERGNLFAAVPAAGRDLGGAGDSLEVRRFKLRGRESELLTRIKLGGGYLSGPRLQQTLNLPVADAGDTWALTSTGIVMAIGQDGRIDLIGEGASRTTTLPLARRAYTPGEKDSLRKSAEALFRGFYLGTTASGDNPPITLGPTTIVGDAIPDFAPLFVPGSAKADVRGRVWLRVGVRQIYHNPQPPEYVILDSSGRIVDRVRLPEGEVLVGFTRDRLYTARYSAVQLTLRAYPYD